MAHSQSNWFSTEVHSGQIINNNYQIDITVGAKHYFALVGLSEPALQDEVVGGLVPFKLSEAEHQFMLQETDIAVDVDSAVDAAEQSFSESYPNGNIYFKKSRFYKGSALHSLRYSTVLGRVGCF
ncbi:MAG: hypothetical protein ACFHW5_03275 [Verrucomicrobiota bacterium]